MRLPIHGHSTYLCLFFNSLVAHIVNNKRLSHIFCSIYQIVHVFDTVIKSSLGVMRAVGVLHPQYCLSNEQDFHVANLLLFHSLIVSLKLSACCEYLLKKHFPAVKSWRDSSMLFSRFVVSCLTLTSKSYLEMIFFSVWCVYELMRKDLFFFHTEMQVIQCYLLNRPFFPLSMSSLP